MSLLRIKEGSPVSVGDIVASVEEVDDQVGHLQVGLPYALSVRRIAAWCLPMI